MKVIILVLVLSLVLVGCMSVDDVPDENVPDPATSVPSERAISLEEFGDGYPFTVDGVLRCVQRGVVFVADGTIYAVNGFARAQMDAQGWADLDAVWADSTEGTIPKKNVGLMIALGNELCQ